jgi:hypothetical protein
MDCAFVSDQTNVVEEIWVNVAEGAEKTGFHPDHVRRLARDNRRLPEDKRYIRIRKSPREYAIWLPDLIAYVKRNSLFPKPGTTPQEVEEIWVNTGEGAEFTGYNMDYLQQVARKMWRRPEDQRAIKVRNRAGRYELWLPDLVTYVDSIRHGPKGKRTKHE